MKLVVTEKNIAGKNISAILADGKPQSDKVYSTPVYRFKHDGEDWVVIGLKGHILEVDFPERLVWKKSTGWEGVDEDLGTVGASLPDGLERPPYKSKRKPYLPDGIDLSRWSFDSLPYLVYAPIVKRPSERDIIRSLKNLAGKADEVIIATDFDREGELIGYDATSMVREVNADVPISRARYSAITKPEITRAFGNLDVLDDGLAHAGESRQFIDLIWGAALTRYLTIVKRSGLGSVRSAGRVQTPTLALVVDLERKRLAFRPEDYWQIKGKFSQHGEEFEAMHAAGRFKEEQAAQAAMSAIEGAKDGTVTSVEKKERRVSAPIPFNTTGLMAAAAAEGISPSRTMRIAESLYMNGYTSYPRVDNTVYPASLDLAGTVKMLSGNPAYAPYCSKLLSKGKLTPTRGKMETTDHPPIYPTGVATPEKLTGADWKLYNLIARRFLATLSDPAIVENTKVAIDVKGEGFALRGDTLVKPGFREVYAYGLKKDDQIPAFETGDVASFLGAELEKKQTEPPARYSQGRLIQEMEKQGLGTKSTRQDMIQVLYDRNYVQNDPIEPTALGFAVITALEEYAPHITSPGMTAELERDMDSVAASKASEDEVVSRSRDMLAGIVGELVPRKEEMAAAISDAVVADSRVGTCPKCGHDLLIKSSAKTRQSFVGCSGWPECDVTYPLPQGKLEATDEVCPVCGTPQIKVKPFRGKQYVHCLNPQCPTNVEPDLDVGACPACKAAGREGRLIAQKNPRTLKRFVRCTNYDECNTSYPLPQKGKLSYEGEVCETCGAPIVVVQSAKGPWHLCVNMDCPSKEKDAKSAPRRSAGRKASARTSASAKASAGKAAPKKAAPKKASTKKAPSKKASSEKES